MRRRCIASLDRLVRGLATFFFFGAPSFRLRGSLFRATFGLSARQRTCGISSSRWFQSRGLSRFHFATHCESTFCHCSYQTWGSRRRIRGESRSRHLTGIEFLLAGVLRADCPGVEARKDSSLCDLIPRGSEICGLDKHHSSPAAAKTRILPGKGVPNSWDSRKTFPFHVERRIQKFCVRRSSGDSR